MQNIEQFVKERQEIYPLQTCESYFFNFSKKICGVSVIRFPLRKTVQVDTRFYQDTDDIFFISPTFVCFILTLLVLLQHQSLYNDILFLFTSHVVLFKHA